MKTKIFCFDLDNVICKTKKNNYKTSKPLKNNIKTINELYKKCSIIKIFTARFMGTYNDNSNLATKSAKKLTIKQLKKWDVKFHKVFFGKPSYDIFIDDKNHNFDKKWRYELKKKFL